MKTTVRLFLGLIVYLCFSSPGISAEYIASVDQQAGSVYVVNTITGSIIHENKSDFSNPGLIEIIKSKNLIAVANATPDQIVFLRLPDLTQVGAVVLSERPTRLDITEDESSLFVSTFTNLGSIRGSVLEIDTATLTIKNSKQFPNSPGPILIIESKGLVVVESGVSPSQVSLLSIRDLSELSTFDIGLTRRATHIGDFEYVGSTDSLYVSDQLNDQVRVYQLSDGQLLSTIDVPRSSGLLNYDESRGVVILTHQSGGIISSIDVQNYAVSSKILGIFSLFGFTMNNDFYYIGDMGGNILKVNPENLNLVQTFSLKPNQLNPVVLDLRYFKVPAKPESVPVMSQWGLFSLAGLLILITLFGMPKKPNKVAKETQLKLLCSNRKIQSIK